MYQIVLTAWMYLTPIIYPEEIIPETYRALLFTLNPMYHLVTLFRQPLYEGVVPSLNHIGLAAAVAVSMFVIGWVIFAEKSDEFAYRV
jgi:ABC-2 type transport system permease protein